MASLRQIEVWRKRAEECRTIAEGFHTEETRKTLVKLAIDYDNMAFQCEAKLKKEQSNEAKVQRRNEF